MKLIPLVVATGCLLGATYPGLAANHEIQLSNFIFTPAQLTIAPGDTVTWIKGENDGVHNVVADDNSFNNGIASSAPFEYSQTFNSVAEIPYYCSPHGAPGGVGMSGNISVKSSNVFDIQYGITGSWYDTNTPGQGFSIEVIPEQNLLLAYWFTFNQAGDDQKWLIAAGNYTGDSAATVVAEPTGGAFDMSLEPTNIDWGTATFQFSSCTEGTVDFTSTSDAVSGIINITRLSPNAACF